MPWWLWLGSGTVLGYGLRLFEMLRHDTRCPEIHEAGPYSDKQSVRCRLYEGHPGPCEARYKATSLDFVKTLGHWEPMEVRVDDKGMQHLVRKRK